MTKIKLSDVYLKKGNDESVSYITVTEDLQLIIDYEPIGKIEIEEKITSSGENVEIKAIAIGTKENKLSYRKLNICLDDDIEITNFNLQVTKNLIQKNENINIKVKLRDRNNQPISNAFINFLFLE